MTGSWTMDAFIVGCIVLIILPAAVCIHKDVIKKNVGDKNGQ